MRALTALRWLDGICRTCGVRRVISDGRRVLSLDRLGIDHPCRDCIEWAER